MDRYMELWDRKKDFNAEQVILIRSLLDDNKLSRVALIRRLLKIKKSCNTEDILMVDSAVNILSKMSDEEYSMYDF